MRVKKLKIQPIKVLLYVILTFVVITAFSPFVYMVGLSLTQASGLSFTLADISFDMINYQRVFRNTNFFRALFNSTIVTGGACILNCLIASMAAYSFAKKKFPGKNFIFGIYMMTLMVPSQVTLIPVFTIINKMGLMNTYPALIVTAINAFGVFLIKQFMSSIPNDLLEAAKIDGCPEFKIYSKIVLPLIKPVLVSLIVFTFITSWNDFIWPLVTVTAPEMRTVTLALSILKGQFTTNYGLVMAGATLSFLFPFTLYCFLQKQFVEGIALSGIKG